MLAGTSVRWVREVLCGGILVGVEAGVEDADGVSWEWTLWVGTGIGSSQGSMGILQRQWGAKKIRIAGWSYVYGRRSGKSMPEKYYRPLKPRRLRSSHVLDCEAKINTIMGNAMPPTN